MGTGKAFLGIVTGLAAGALLGVLFSPEKGSDTRKKISKRGEDYGNTLKKRLTDFLDNISERLEMAKEEISRFPDQDKVKSEEGDKDMKTETD